MNDAAEGDPAVTLVVRYGVGVAAVGAGRLPR